MTWHLQLLGPVSLRRDGEEIDVGGNTARAVLAALALTGPSGAGVADLVERVWGAPDEVSRDTVYHYIKQLRRALGPSGRTVVFSRHQRYGLALAVEQVDWREFIRSADEGNEAGDLTEAAARLTRALALWHGPPLDGIDGRLEIDRREMRARHTTVTEQLAGLEATLGHPERVRELLDPVLIAEPGRERSATLLVHALTALGRREEAGTVFHRTRAHLAEELGLDPSPELANAYRNTLHQPRPRAAGLPRADRHFTDRSTELRRLVDALDGGAICVVTGMAGVGKTALAIRAAASLTERFPDGTVLLDLKPLSENDAVDRVLRRLGVPGERIPSDLEDLRRLYRQVTAGRNALLVLDNARDAAHVAPLLPAGSGCGVIVTSRRRLAALDDAEVIALGTFRKEDAIALFRAVAGPTRLAVEPDADASIADVVDRCGRLPLAIRIAAARHRAQPHRTVADLDEELADAHRRLAALDDGERSVAASFRVSSTELWPTAAQLLALLAGHPGTDVDVFAATALAGTPIATTVTELEALTDRHLVLARPGGRYRLHDLIATFARGHQLSPNEETPALRRWVAYYASAANAADTVLTPDRFRIPLDVAGTPPEPPPFPTYDAALSWFDAELDNLAAACALASTRGWDSWCWQIAYGLRGYFYLTKRWAPWVTTHSAAVDAARRSGDLRAEAITLNNLGLAFVEQDAGEIAATHYGRARELFERIGDEHGAMTSRANLAWIAFADRRYEVFLRELEPVAEFYFANGSDRNGAITIRGMALAEAELGDLDAAIAHLERALAVFRPRGLLLDTAMTFNGLGDAYRLADRPAEAARAYRNGLATAAQSGSRYEMARAHHRLGQLAVAHGDRVDARQHWETALEEYRALRAPHAEEVAAALDSLSG